LATELAAMGGPARSAELYEAIATAGSLDTLVGASS
jgi:hypothetical protein